MIYHRKANRLAEYDYSQNGAYFITVCVKQRLCALAKIVGGGVLDAPQVILSDYGKIVENRIQSMNETYSTIQTVKYVIMPNHIHLLVHITEEEKICSEGTSRTPSPTNALIPRYVPTLKRMCNQDIGSNLWQRSYHDHVIRGEKDYQMIWQYIDTNPVRWKQDCFYRED